MINRFAALITILLLLLYYNFPTSCVFVLADSAADSASSLSSTVFPENFFSQSSSDHTMSRTAIKNTFIFHRHASNGLTQHKRIERQAGDLSCTLLKPKTPHLVERSPL